jgi:hypothetical protein
VAGASILGTTLIAVGAFWLSFTALTDLARRAGVATAWVWPLIVDGLIVVATIAAVVLAGRRAAWYPWMLLTGGAVLSVAANAVHATLAPSLGVPPVIAAVVASVPPGVLVAVTHLTVVLTKTHAQADESGTPVVAAETVSGTMGADSCPTDPVTPVAPWPTDRSYRHPTSPGPVPRVPAPWPPEPPGLTGDTPAQARPAGLGGRSGPSGGVPSNAQAEAGVFILDYLAARGGHAPAGDVTAAAHAQGFSMDAVKHARARACHPRITSTRGPHGWVWAVETGAEGA